MRETGEQRRSASGFGAGPALAILLAVSALCAFLAADARKAPVVSREQRDREQSYLSAVSAARFLREAFGRDSLTAGSVPEAFDFTAARAVLRRLDEAAETGYMEDTLTLGRPGFDAAPLNDALSVPVRFTRIDSGTVTASIGGGDRAGHSIGGADRTGAPSDGADRTGSPSDGTEGTAYPITLSLPVYTATLICTTYRADGTAESAEEVNRGTFPEGYPPAAAAEELRQSAAPPEAVDFDYTCTYAAGEGESIPPVKLWKVLWRYQWESGAGTETRNLAAVSLGGGAEPPAAEEIERPDAVPSLPMSPGEGAEPETGKAWVFRGWPDYEAYTVSPGDRTVTVTGRFEQWDRRSVTWVAWVDSAGTVLGSADYAVNPLNPQEAVWFDSLTDGHSLHPQTPDRSTEYDACTFREWREIGTVPRDGVPVTTMRAMYAVTAKRDYGVRWLDGSGAVLAQAAAKAGEPEPVTDKIPVRTEADQFFPFLYWDDGTMETEDGAPLKVYRPQFGPGQARHTFVWADGEGRELLRLEYGDNAPSDEEAAALGPDSALSWQPPESNGYYHYTFRKWSGWKEDGWTKTKTPVYETARPIADKGYAILWLDGDGMEIASRTVSAGSAEPAAPSVPAGFSGWDLGTMGTEYNPSIKVYWPQ